MDLSKINNLKDFELALKKPNNDLHNEDEHQTNTYMLAAKEGKLFIMKHLERHYHWNIYLSDVYGFDAYLLAAANGHVDIMKHLEREHKWDFTVSDHKNSYSALLLGILNNHFPVIEHYINEHADKSGFNLNVTDKYGSNGLALAIKRGNFNFVQMLIEIGIDIYAKDYFGLNPLLYACKFGKTEIFKYLMSLSKYDIDTVDSKGYNCYIYATLSDSVEILKYLDKNSEWSKNTRDNAYSAAESNRKLKALEYFNKNNIYINKKTKELIF